MAASLEPVRELATSPGSGMVPGACDGAVQPRRGIALRAVEDSDDRFLLVLYGSTRAHELANLPWSDEQKHTFVRSQCEAQQRFYGEHFAGARHWIVECEGRAIGRLYVDRTSEEIRIVDIALLPEFRNRGIGAALIADVLDEARAEGVPVRLHVEKHNPALRLYGRLGFAPLADHGVYWLMEWRAAGTPRETVS